MHARLARSIVGGVVAVMAIGVAHADVVYVQPPAGGPPQLLPGFALLDRQDGSSRIGADATYLLLDNDANDAHVMRFDLHGQFVNPQSRLGGYAALPIAYFNDSTTDSTFAVGNLELGGIFLPRIRSPNVALATHFGITLPTGDDSNDALIGTLVGLMRPADIFQAFPRSSTLRLGISPLYRSGNVFGRLDFGIDINVYVADGDTADPAIHLNLGAGYDTGSVAIMGELSILELTGDNSEAVTVGAVSVRGTGALGVHPYGAVIVPLDKDVSDLFDLGLMLGLEANL